MNKSLKVGAVVATSVLLFAGASIAEGREDFYTQTNQQRYFNLPENARTLAMAGSSVSSSSDSSSVVGNPAGLGFMKDADVSVSYARDQISGNDDYDYSSVQADGDMGDVLVALPIMPTLDGTPQYGTVGLGWTGYKSDSDTAANLESRQWGLTAAYGKDISDSLALGYRVSYLHKKVSGHAGDLAAAAKMDDGIVQDIGLQYKADADTTVGFDTSFGFGKYGYDLANQTDQVKIGNEDVHSWAARAGVSHTLPSATTLAFSVDYTNYESNKDSDSFAWGVRTGVEQSFTDWLKGRLGVRYQANMDYNLGYGNNNAKYNAVSFGAGVKLMPNLYADYGAEVRFVGEGADWTHEVTVSVPFSLCMNDK